MNKFKSNFKNWSKIRIFFWLFFLFLILCSLKPSQVEAVTCKGFEDYISKAAQGTGLTAPGCTGNSNISSTKAMHAMLYVETSCGGASQKSYTTPNLETCKQFRTSFNCKGKRNTPECISKQEWNCINDWNILNDICTRKLGRSLSQCPTNKMLAMGPAQFMPSTWKAFEKKFRAIQITNPDPWTPQHAMYAMALHLEDRHYCKNPRDAIGLYHGRLTHPVTQWYIAQVLKGIDTVGKVVTTVYEEIKQRIRALREYKRELEIKYPEILGIKLEKTVEVPLAEYIKYIFSFAVLISGFILLGVIIAGGFRYLLAAGDPVKMKVAREQITNGFLGIIILLAGYFILYTINPQLVILPSPKIPSFKKIPAPPEEVLVPATLKVIQTELSLGQLLEEELLIQGPQKEAPADTEKAAQEKVINQEEALLHQGIGTVADLAIKLGSLKKAPADTEKAAQEKVINQEEALLHQGIGTVADLAIKLKSLAGSCHCDKLKGLCTKVYNFGIPIGCVGDPCPKKIRKQIEEINKAIMARQKELSDFIEKINEANKEIINNLSKFHKAEEFIFSCQRENYGLTTLPEHALQLDFLKKQGLEVETITLPEISQPKKQDALTFYCTVGGNYLDYPGLLPREKLAVAPLELKLLYGEKVEPGKMTCPVEIPLGEFLDEARETNILLSLNYQNIAYYQNELTKKLEKLNDYISQCTDQNCRVNCCCVPNPCYEPACGIPPARINKCGTGKCTPPTPATPNPCYPYCDSPCLQTVGGCYGKACPYKKIEKIVEEIKKTEEKLFENISKFQQGLSNTSFLAKEGTYNEINLPDLRQTMELCVSSDIENPTLKLFTCDQIIGSYDGSGKIITSCHPRNFYCCILPGKEVRLPSQLPQKLEPTLFMPFEKPKILEPDKDGCPKGWTCSPEAAQQYKLNHASPALKELLACVREKLDQVQKEKELKESLGRIINISDQKIVNKLCNWVRGGDCSHQFSGDKISCHYGGFYCRYQEKSYAVDFAASPERPADAVDEVIKALKQCEPRVHILIHEPPLLHASIGDIYQCGCKESLSAKK